MICRLCLNSLNNGNEVMIFQGAQSCASTLAKLISKYINLEVTQDDSISTSICMDCCSQLEDFHNFWLQIDKKQSTLRNEFLEIKCDVDIGSAEELATNLNADGEALFDLSYLPVAEDNVGTNTAPKCEFQYCKTEAEDTEDTNDNEGFGVTDSISADNLEDNVPLSLLVRKQVSPKVLKKATRPIPGKTKQNEFIINSFMSLVCDMCKAPAANYDELRNHYLAEHKTNPYIKCCNVTFKKPCRLVEHIKWHQNPDSFKCEICHRTLRSKQCLLAHMELLHSDDDKSKIKESVKSVDDKNTPKELLRCPICKRQFHWKKRLEEHIKKHEAEVDAFVCQFCNKRFINAHRLRSHINAIHENLHPHICDICGKKFKFKPSFERHLLEHQGVVEPPEQCDICGEWLKTKNGLRSHRLRHVQDNTTCNFCGRVCPSLIALKRHVNYKHKLKHSFQCTYCDKTFKVARNLDEHVATHTGAQLYDCPHCTKDFRSKANMYMHIKRMHVEEWVKSKIARSNDPNLKARANNIQDIK